MRSGRTGHRRGLMLILSAPSGAGKTTLTREILAAEGEKCCLSISATTRPPRSYEIDGQDYFFLSREAFVEQRQAGALLESAEVFGHLYGTPKMAVEDSLTAGRDVLFDIDWQGARQLAENSPGDAVRVFILPPSREELEARLKGRASDSAEAVTRRLAGASEEIRHWNEADYVIINDDIQESLRSLQLILHAERLKRMRQEGLDGFVHRLLDV
ncbi:MAG TPA: guanylate kinase [Hyphomicrobiales bacterium]|nr:guanylate kinase [Hyphomicrobiales bacterium]